MNRLEDVDVSGVHFVGEPANRRPFAIVKNLAGRKPEGRTMKKADLQKAIAAAGDELTPAQLAEIFGGKDVLVKELGLTPPKPDEAKAATDDPPADATAKALNAAITKAVQPLIDEIKTLKDARATEAKQALTKRAEALVELGYEIEIEKVSEAEIGALEKAHAHVAAAADRLGLTKAFGSPTAAEPTSGAAAVQVMVRKRVVDLLGREPIDKAEQARAKREIYRANPGLLTAVIEAERTSHRAA